jgi:AsmA protein
MSRFILFLIAIPLGLILLAAVLLPLLLDEEKILELASAAIYQQTGATLTVRGDVELDLFPGIGVSLEDVSLTMPQEQQSSLQIRSLLIGVQLRPLLSGKVAIDALELDGMTTRIPASEQQDSIDTSKLSDRQLDDFYAQRRKAQAEAGDAAGSQAALAAPLALEVKTLKLTDARLELLDAAGGAATVIELLSLKATGLNLDARPIPLSLKLRIPGEQTAELALEGKVVIDQERQQLSLQQIELELTGATPQPVKLQTTGEIDINRQIAKLQLKLALADTRGEGTVRYASFESPQIDATMHFNLFDPAVLALAGSEAVVEADSGSQGSGDEPLPLAALRSIDTRANLAIDKAVFDAHTINQLQVELRALDGVIELGSLTGELHGGKLELQATFNGKHNIATLTTTGTIKQLDIATALAAAAVEPALTGTASLDWQLASNGRTSNELVAALNGPIRLATEQVVLKDIGIEHMLCQAVALTNKEKLTATFPTSTSFQTLGADIQLADGKARLNPLRAELPQITLTGTGAFDLLSQDFKTTFKARLSPELETLDHACRVSKRLTAIDWPVDCKGNTATDPATWCSVDTAEIIEDLGKNEAERKLKKEAGKLLNKLFKKD